MDYLGNLQTTLLRLWVELYAVPGNNRRVTRWHNFIVTKHKHLPMLKLIYFLLYAMAMLYVCQS